MSVENMSRQMCSFISVIYTKRMQRLLILIVIFLFGFAFYLQLSQNPVEDPMPIKLETIKPTSKAISTDYQEFSIDSIEIEIAKMPGFTRPDPNAKFFKEAAHSPHLDVRYGSSSKGVSATLRHEYLVLLLKSFMETCKTHNIQVWIAHGTLIGWHWNQKLLPWDDDMDMQMTLLSMFQLWKLTNTMINERYLLEVNPNFIYRYHQIPNVIDARYIDTLTGHFIDITALAPVKDKIDVIACKSPHYYHIQDIFPLEKSLLEGVEVYVPKNKKDILKDEYGAKVYTAGTFGNYRYNRNLSDWERL